jgi:hypothetical protein
VIRLRPLHHLGVNIFEVDPVSCSLVAAQQFDTSVNSSGAAYSLAAYLDTISFGTVLVGVTAFDPMTGLLPALNALSALGVSVNDVPIQGSFAFVALKASTGYRTILKKTVSVDETAARLNAQLLGEKLRIDYISSRIILNKSSFRFHASDVVVHYSVLGVSNSNSE